MGEAMKIEEEVPMMIPNMIARPKPRITSPPISARGRIERTTVSDVATVRPRVWLMLRSMSCNATSASAVASRPLRNNSPLTLAPTTSTRRISTFGSASAT
jgi:hypothetical protein